MGKNLIFIGFMGALKSSVGAMAAQLANAQHLDSDQILQKDLGSIAQFFKTKGEPIFREREEQLMYELVKHSNAVISLGGGSVLNGKAMEQLGKGSLVVWLKDDFSRICQRIEADKKQDRPLFRDKNSARQLFDARQQIYRGFANEIICIGECSVRQAAWQAVELWRKYF